MPTRFQYRLQCRFRASRLTMLALASAVLAACASSNLLSDQDAIDYKSSKTAPRLEVPPDLTQLKPNDRFALRGAVSATGTLAATPTGMGVLPVASTARIERAGGTRWLVVNMPAEKVYPIVVDFWKQLGFTLAIESPAMGIMETDWAENRAKLPKDGLRKLLGGVIDGLFDSGERDKYRTRIERAANGSTEIYLTHRGTKEYNASTTKEADIKTVQRNNDIELESEFMRRLMLRFGADENVAKAATSSSAVPKDRATIQDNTLAMDDAFDTAWRRMGIALDRTGFTVEDRNFSQGVYDVRYARSVKEEDVGFFKRIFTSEKERLSTSQKLRIVMAKSGQPVMVSIQTDAGSSVAADIAQNVLAVLHEELK